MKTLVIIDEDFERYEGHPYDYNKSVKRMFEEQGYHVVIYGHKNMLPEFVEELDAKPWFTFNRAARVRKIPVLGTILYRSSFWKRYKCELAILLTELSKKHKDYFIFFPNAYWFNILPIAWGLKRVNVPVGLLFRISIFTALRQPKFMKPVILSIIKRSVKILSKNRNIHYFTDSEVIKEEWEAEIGMPMRVLPLPHLERQEAVVHTRDTNKIRLYLPGAMRIEKGAALLTDAFEVLARNNPEMLQRIILVTQFGKDENLLTFKTRLGALPVENVFLKFLTTEEYNDQLSRADVILVPYLLSEGYHARTSGILAEAISSAKPFITTDNTWMAYQSRKFDTGLIVNDGQPEELAKAICNLIDKYRLYEQKAKAAVEPWNKSQSKEVFVSQLTNMLVKD